MLAGGRLILTLLQIAIHYVKRRIQWLNREPQRIKTRPARLWFGWTRKARGLLSRAAELRHISVSDYVRRITVAQARKEVDGASERTIVLTPDEQLAIWNALNTPVKLTPSQKILGKIMRGKS